MTKSKLAAVCLFALVGGYSVGFTMPLPTPTIHADALVTPTVLMSKNLTGTPGSRIVRPRG